MQTDINLIKTATEFSGEFMVLQERLRLGSVIATGALLLVGLILGGMYFFLQTRLTTLKAQESTLTSTLTKSSVKEGLYLSFKDRVSIVSKVMKLQMPHAGVLNSLRTIAPAGALSAFSVDEKNTVTTSITVSSVEDLGTFVANILKVAKSGGIKNPILEGVTLEKGGTFKMTLSFVGVPQP